VTDFVDCEEEVLIRCRANDVGCQEEFPREERSIAEQTRAEDLQSDDRDDKVLRERLWPAELCDFGMCFDDGLSSCSVWFFGVGPEKVIGILCSEGDALLRL